MAIFPKLSSTLSNGSITPHSSHTQHSQGHSPSGSSSSTITNNLIHNNAHPFEMSIDLESPPIILYGPPNESSGSLVSGQLVVDIPKESFASQQRPSNKRTTSSGSALNQLHSTLSNLNISPSVSHAASPLGSGNSSSTNLMLLNQKDHVLINSIQLSLIQKVHYAKPFLPPSNTLAGCNSCKKRSAELARWDIMLQAHNLPVGKHSYPFSHLLPGALPATTCLGSSAITSIKYELVAIASYNNHNNHQTLVKVTLPINISRSILRGPDRNSLRVFPPTDVTATAVLPNVVYPRSSFALELKLDGVSSAERRWRMRRVAWRIEENIKVKGNACMNHKTKLRVVEEHVRKTQHLTRPTAKRNQQSGPTTQVTVSDASRPELTPSPSNNQGIQPQQSTPVNQLQPSNSNDDIASIHTENNLHPSDHANEELRQQQEQQQLDEERKKQEYALYCEETRTVASGDLRNGWKSDFSDKGKIELVADISCFNLSSAAGPHHTHVSSKSAIEQPVIHPTVSCDIDDPVLGITCTHVLIVEVVIAEEVLQSTSSSGLTPASSHSESKKDQTSDQRLAELSPVFANHIKPSQSNSSQGKRPEDSSAPGSSSSSKTVGVPTGSARVLRMQFKMNITERSGLGIAWDDEVPPMYDDVSALSPPTYETTMSPVFSPEAEPSTNPPLYPLNPAHTHTHINGSQGAVTPGVIYGIGNTPGVTPRHSSQFQSLNGALDPDDFTLN